MRIFKHIFYITSLLLLQVSTSHAQYYAFHIYSVSDGIPQGQIFHTFQDQQGFLWLGTLDGACRYDGTEFFVINQSSGLLDNHINHINSDDTGRIWLSTNKGGLACYDPSDPYNKISFNLSLNNSPLPSNRINCTAWSRQRELWAATDSGVVRIRFKQNIPNEYRVFGRADGLLDLRVNTVFEDRRGRIWIGTWGKGLAHFDSKSETFINYPGLPDAQIFSASKSPRGGFWIAIAGGIFHYFDVDSLGQEIIRSFQIDDWSIDDRVYAVLESQAGKVWVGTWGSGLLSLDISPDFKLLNPKRYTTRNGLPNNQIRSLLEDREGSLWIGANSGGICKFRNPMFSNFTIAAGLPQNLISAIFRDSKNNIWIGTNDEGVCRYSFSNPGEFSHFTVRDGLPNNQVRAITEDRQGRIWIGTRRGAAAYRDNKILTDLSDKTALQIDAISTFTASDGSVWFGSYGSGIYVYRNEKFQRFTREDGLLSNYGRTITQLANGEIWIGSLDGISRYKDGRFSALTAQDSLPLVRDVAIIFQDSHKRIWIGSDGGSGVVCFANGQARQFTTNDGLSNNIIYSITEDLDGNIWFGTNRGVDRYDGESFVNFNARDGFVNDQCMVRAATCDQQGQLWFGTVGGLSRIDPTQIVRNRVPPTTRITFFAVLDKPQALADNVTLSHHENYVAFEFRALSFANESQVRYQFYLDGLDKGWSPPIKFGTIRYPNLNPGQYIFRVKACNNEGVWNEEPTTFRFTILPPAWKSPAFLAILLVMIAGLIYGLYRWRTGNLRRQKADLQRKIEERTEEIVRKNLQLYERQEAIAEANQEMILKNHELEVRQRIISQQKEKLEHQKAELEAVNQHLAEMNEVKNQFLGMAAHDLRNPLGVIAAYLEILEDDSETMVGEERQKIFRQLSKLSNHMQEMVSNLLDVVAIESGKVSLNCRLQNFYQFVDECLLLYKFQADKKRIQIMRELPLDLPDIYMDANRLTEVLGNLVGNAIKYSHPDTTVTINAKVHNAFLHVHVRDQGQGLSEDDLQKVFRSFQKLSARPTAGETSTGLGLAIVKKLVELHGGEVWVESRLGLGSMFSFSLPLEVTDKSG